MSEEKPITEPGLLQGLLGVRRTSLDFHVR
jgi:hypothetical protein